jgi:hypothetical protein
LNLQDYDNLWRSIYRELANNGLQAKIFAAGIGEGTLTTYCGIYAKESLTRECRADYETEITSSVHNAAISQGATMQEFAFALSKALKAHFYPEEAA